MPASRPTTDWANITVYGFADQKEFINIFWYSIFSGAPTDSWDAHAAAGVIYAAVATTLADTMNSGAALIGCEFFYNFGAGTFGVDYYSSFPGTLNNKLLPEDVAVVVQKITALGGKTNRGRWYLAGVDSSLVSGSYLNPTGQTSFQTFAVAAKTNVTDQGITYAPAHFSLQTTSLVPIKNTPVVALLATRRRRRYRF